MEERRGRVHRLEGDVARARDLVAVKYPGDGSFPHEGRHGGRGGLQLCHPVVEQRARAIAAPVPSRRAQEARGAVLGKNARDLLQDIPSVDQIGARLIPERAGDEVSRAVA